MQKFDIGPVGSHKGIGVATLTFTPFLDRAAIVQRIILDAPSASDTWVLSCSGRELARFRQSTLGNQQVLGGTGANFPKNSDIFAFLQTALNIDLSYPIPQAQSLTIASVGGATATITMLYTEQDAGDINAGLTNHPQGSHFIVPVWLQPGNALASTAGVVESDYVAQIAPSWFPQFWGLNELPAGYDVSVLGIFAEGAGINTFSGAANHASVTDHIALMKNGMRFFTRDANDGIPVVGPAAAAGSANTVFGAVNAPFPAFQLTEYVSWEPFQPALHIGPGDQFRWMFSISGDATGGADYTAAYLLMLLDVRLRSAS